MGNLFKYKMKNWSAIVISIGMIGIVLILYSRFYDSSFALNIGVIIFSFAGIFVGIESIIRRRIILRSPYHKRLSETYIGLAAVSQGLIIIFIGLLLIAIIILNLLAMGRSTFLYFVIHPGIPFIIFSAFCFLTALPIIIGSLEEKHGSKFVFILNLITTRALAGTILTALGLVCLCLGLLELVNPQYFDSIGGGFLEVLFLGN
jgi:hypothetical protein